MKSFKTFLCRTFFFLKQRTVALLSFEPSVSLPTCLQFCSRVWFHHAPEVQNQMMQGGPNFPSLNDERLRSACLRFSILLMGTLLSLQRTQIGITQIFRQCSVAHPVCSPHLFSTISHVDIVYLVRRPLRPASSSARVKVIHSS